MRRSKEDLQIVQLEPGTFALKRIWSSVTHAARELGVTREGIYQSTRDGSVRYDSIWLFYSNYRTWEAAHREARKS